jgi:flavin-binding protein dodecin
MTWDSERRRIGQSERHSHQEAEMAVAKIIEITAMSENSFEDAIKRGIEKASETVHNIKGAWVKEQKVLVEDGSVSGYRVDLKVSFVLD